MKMDYKDAIEYLRIAENAYNAEAFSESAEILEKVARYIAYDSENLSSEQRKELTDKTMAGIGRFHWCPDEALWEEVSALSDFFRE